MSQKSSAPPTRVPAEKLARDIRRVTRKHHSAEVKIRIVLEDIGFGEGIENTENYGSKSFAYSVPIATPFKLSKYLILAHSRNVSGFLPTTLLIFCAR